MVSNPFFGTRNDRMTIKGYKRTTWRLFYVETQQCTLFPCSQDWDEYRWKIRWIIASHWCWHICIWNYCMKNIGKLSPYWLVILKLQIEIMTILTNIPANFLQWLKNNFLVHLEIFIGSKIYRLDFATVADDDGRWFSKHKNMTIWKEKDFFVF